MNCQILISFLIFYTGSGVQFDNGEWKPMPQGHPRMPQQPKRQNLERIENQRQQRTHPASLIQDNVVDDSKPVRRPSKDIVKTPLSIKKNQVVTNNGVPPVTRDSIHKPPNKNAVATDRAGNFFSRPPAPVTINLRHANGRNAPRSSPNTISIAQNVRHNIIHNTPQPQQHNSRPLTHHNSRPSPQHNTFRPQQQHNSNLPNVRQHQVRSGQAAVPARPVQHRSSHNNNVRLPQNFNTNIQHQLRQGRVLEDNDALQNDMKKSENKEPEAINPSEDTTEDIVMTFDFEDIEAKAKAKTERSAFIDPAQLEVNSEGHDHEAEAHHEGGHEGGHEGDKNQTQASDPHGEQQFCVDISEYLDLKWVIKDSEECHVTFTNQCETKSENVCIDVTETKCEVVPYKECKMGLEPMEYTEKKLAPKLFVEKSCYEGKKTIPHKKLFPECRNVTKQNCVTLWETDDNGEQIWAGTEQCEPVTWQECELKEKDVKFIVPEVTCADKQELWYHEPEPIKGSQMTNTFTCEVEKSSHCSTQTRPDCKQITYNECREVPVRQCKAKKVHVPTQELLHRKKCLLPDDIALPVDDGYGKPQGSPLSSYGNNNNNRNNQRQATYGNN